MSTDSVDLDEIALPKAPPSRAASHNESSDAPPPVCVPTSKEAIEKRLFDLRLKMNKERKMNIDKVKDEELRLKEGPAARRAKARAEAKEQEEKAQEEAKEAGVDLGRKRMLEVTAEEAEREQFKKRAKKKEVHGWSAFNQDGAHYAYRRRVSKIKVDHADYAKKKRETDEETFYPDANAIAIVDEKVDEEAVERMAQDVRSKRKAYSRHRSRNEDDDVDYINRRNEKFNKKADRFFNKYTVEIKQNLERGTAV
eukprot:TRINITY_DN1172_c0_g1_i1.p1 TRINITY_DN1172_c0_g1~~TRINITY_DN1172_c0_g1_i1.p1  ORF type:complete len:271 (+),score=117.95 TRINITY_DN1172_c0_g1_i1:53-814(+)